MNLPPMWNLESDVNCQKMFDLLVDQKLYLLAGAGLSCRVDIPDWGKLLKEFADAYKQQPQHSSGRAAELDRLAISKDLDLIELMVNDVAGVEAMIGVLKKYFVEKACDPLHEKLLRLPFCGFVTTNYDRCFESACDSVRERIALAGDRWFCFPPHDGQSLDVNTLFSGDPFLLHMHGCFWHAGSVEIENIVLTRSQYLRFYPEPAMQDILARLSKKHLLLIGTSFSDPYFRDALLKYRRRQGFNERANLPEWYILHGSKDAPNLYPIRDQENYRLQHIYYAEEAAQDSLANLIDHMLEAVERKKRPLKKLSDSDVEGLGGRQ